MNVGLREPVKELRGKDCKWVGLSYELRLTGSDRFDYPARSLAYVLDYSPDALKELAAPAKESVYHAAGQHGTYADALSHFWDSARRLDAIKWLAEERNIGAIGHEAADTDPSYVLPGLTRIHTQESSTSFSWTRSKSRVCTATIIRVSSLIRDGSWGSCEVF